MKTFGSAYNTSKRDSLNKKRVEIENDHSRIITAMKKEFGINSFSSLTESEKISYRSMLNEMWNNESGLTSKGVRFLNEAYAPLTPDSTPEQIKKAFQREIKANVNNYLAICSGNSDSWDDALTLKKRIEADIKRKLNVKDCKQWIFEIVSGEIAKKIKAFKF